MENSTYKLIMMTSADYLDLYKSLVNSSLREKDYDLMLQRQSELVEAIAWIRETLENLSFADKSLFESHISNTEAVNDAIMPMIIGLKAKAEATGKYGFFQYRKDSKHLDTAYDDFELTGNQMKALSSVYM